ncbi:hypothetical protein Aab01nite_39230 [Paractinoplanes abujensis]|uniref:Uncharacterized protein n=1 Tax=Paractinoplanes abujensis TaxID=882441 RepID=A0A7W7CTK9_9ACTN|nr:hypothetical protein [Actinoplanes abujensis]MBB4694455.1 hypothetical protein [Actinoplanes abujensis]GID20333.1 hypothetical protein Aab01nite_39230 [Actinoplanes abujensis]
MFPYNDPYAMLDLHLQRANRLAEQAASARRARETAQPEVRRFGRWPRRAARAAVA